MKTTVIEGIGKDKLLTIRMLVMNSRKEPLMLGPGDRDSFKPDDRVVIIKPGSQRFGKKATVVKVHKNGVQVRIDGWSHNYSFFPEYIKHED